MGGRSFLMEGLKLVAVLKNALKTACGDATLSQQRSSAVQKFTKANQGKCMRRNPNKAHYFEDIASKKTHQLSLARGTKSDRLIGLPPLLEQAEGMRVLDLGCYMGWVAEAFAIHGASVVDAVDLYQPGVESASELLSAQKAEFRVARCDLRGGYAALDEALPGGAPYDIILYLGLHHHLRKSMSKGALDTFIMALIDRTTMYFAFRTTEKYFDDVATTLEAQGFALWHHSPKVPEVGKLSVYKRAI